MTENYANNKYCNVKPKSFIPYLPGILLTVIIFFPGSMSNDSTHQLLQARKHFYYDHHPPIMAFLWHWLDLIVRGPFLWLCLQTTIIWLSVGYIAKFYLNNSFNNNQKYLITIATYFILFYPPVFGIIGVVWKDIFMLGNLMMSIALYVKFKKHISEIKLNSKKVLAMIVMILAFTITMSSRHNAFAAVFFILWFICYNFNSDYHKVFLSLRLLITFIIAFFLLGLVFITSNILNNILTDKKSYIQQTLFLYDIGHISFLSKDLSLINNDLYNVGGILNRKIFYRELKKAFNSKSNTKYLKSLQLTTVNDPIKIELIKKIWINSIRTYPYEYLKWRCLVFLDMTKNIRGNHLLIVDEFRDDRQDKLRIYVDYSQFQVFLTKAFNFLPFALYNPLWYFIFSIILFITLPFINWEKFYFVWFLLGSGLNYQVSLFFSAATADYRYSHWMVFCTVISIIFIVLPKSINILNKIQKWQISFQKDRDKT